MESKKSKLVPVGAILMGIGLLLPRQIWSIAESMASGLLQSLLYISTDIFRVCFYLGLIFLIVGILRNRKLKKLQSESPEEPPHPRKGK